MKARAQILAQLMLASLVDNIIVGTLKATQTPSEIEKFVYPKTKKINSKT